MMTKEIEGSFPEDSTTESSTESTTESSTDEDCISREAAIEIIENWLSYGDYNEGERNIMKVMQSILHELPSVKPKADVDALINKIETEFSWSMYDDWGNTTYLHDELIDFIREWAERSGE